MDEMSIERKRILIGKALHTAWGNAHPSSQYEKYWWLMIARVLEGVTCSEDPEIVKFLAEIDLPIPLDASLRNRIARGL